MNAGEDRSKEGGGQRLWKGNKGRYHKGRKEVTDGKCEGRNDNEEKNNEEERK